MSGPKADEISRGEILERLERERVRFFHITARCARLVPKISALAAECVALDMPPTQSKSRNVDVSALERSFNLNPTSAALAEAESILSGLESSARVMEASITARRKHLEELFHQASARLRSAEERLPALTRSMSAFEIRGVDKQEASEIVHRAVSNLRLPGKPAFILNPQSIRQLRTFAQETLSVIQTIEKAEQDVLSVLNRQLLDSLDRGAQPRREKQQGIAEAAEHLCQVVPEPMRFDLHLDDRLDILSADLTSLGTGSARDTLLAVLAAAKGETDEDRKRDLWNSLQIEFSAARKKEFARKEWLGKLEHLQDILHPQAGDADVDALAAHVAELIDSGAAGDLAELDNQVHAAVSLASDRRARREQLLAVTSSLRELGYETTSSEERTQASRWIVRRQEDGSYALSVTHNHDRGYLQMQVVRFASGTAPSSGDHRRADREQEDRFCGVHEQFTELLAGRGYNLKTIAHIASGIFPVKEVAREVGTGSPVAEHVELRAVHRKK